MTFSKKLNQKRMMKGDVWYVSTFFFLITIFFVTMIMLFSMSIARLIVGNLIDFTVHATFLDFSLNTENALVSGTEIRLSANEPQSRRILSNAAFQWDGSPNWDGEVLADGSLRNVYQEAQNVFDKLVQGPYIFELRKQFDVAGNVITKRLVIAKRNDEKIVNDPETAEVEFYLPYETCAGCKIAIYRLYSTVK
ncbi:MAG: hypothetical protein HYS53_02510 [Candidatus Aenigmarchaeota archaeon]|nr:hypothetical protein [Candidatus Aenigmarchaeota archaeon]